MKTQLSLFARTVLARAPAVRALVAVAGLGLAASAHAVSTVYSFTGLYYGYGTTQTYSGSFSITDPVLTSVRPAMAPDMTDPTWNGIWAGTSQFYTGGAHVAITFASGTTITAPSFGIVVNNTTFSGQGAAYPMGLSVQLYPSPITVTAPTHDVCATPGGICGPDDDPLYQDATQALLMATTGIYFPFYGQPAGYSATMPNLAQSFAMNGIAFGTRGVNLQGNNYTQLHQVNSFTAVTTAVPEAGTVWMLMAGLAGLGVTRRFKR